jgi:hypothetical protein
MSEKKRKLMTGAQKALEAIKGAKRPIQPPLVANRGIGVAYLLTKAKIIVRLHR